MRNFNKMKREETIQRIRDEKLVVIVRGVERDRLIPFAEAVYEGGVRLLETTFDASGRISDEQTAENIRMLVDHFGERMLVGAGTVLTEEQVELTARAGGCFIISPDTDADVIRKTRELGLVSMPGALTPSECKQAYRAGADFVKLFPADNLGPAYLKALSAPLSHIPFLAVGGVEPDNIAAYMKAGAVGFGVGSKIASKPLIQNGDYLAIRDLAAAYVDAIREGQR